ncbi:MAG TPA: FMN-binding protein [Bdellovibrionota bacterium]|nr:FMN-binding protein [Bdellovibrionota bacterium]
MGQWILFLALTQVFLAPRVIGAEAEPTPTEEEIGKEQILLTEDQALKETFPEAARFENDTKEISPEIRRNVEQKIGHPFEEQTLVFHRAVDKNGSLFGYGLVMNEKGKYRPITILVAITPELAVKEIAVMVYRESRGGEVSRKRFLRQFEGKSPNDPIRIHRDIIHISGATISSDSVAVATRRALIFTREFYGPVRVIHP